MSVSVLSVSVCLSLSTLCLTENVSTHVICLLCIQPVQGNDNDDAALGDKLHHSMVRASLEHGLAHHTPETLRELMRTGVYKASAEEAKLERQEREVRNGTGVRVYGLTKGV